MRGEWGIWPLAKIISEITCVGYFNWKYMPLQGQERCRRDRSPRGSHRAGKCVGAYGGSPVLLCHSWFDRTLHYL